MRTGRTRSRRCATPSSRGATRTWGTSSRGRGPSCCRCGARACVSVWGLGDGRCSFVGRAGRWAWPGLLGSAGGERLQQGVVGDKPMLLMRLGVSAALHVGGRQLPMHVQPCQEEQHQLEVTLAGQHTQGQQQALATTVCCAEVFSVPGAPRPSRAVLQPQWRCDSALPLVLPLPAVCGAPAAAGKSGGGGKGDWIRLMSTEPRMPLPVVPAVWHRDACCAARKLDGLMRLAGVAYCKCAPSALAPPRGLPTPPSLVPVLQLLGEGSMANIIRMQFAIMAPHTQIKLHQVGPRPNGGLLAKQGGGGGRIAVLPGGCRLVRAAGGAVPAAGWALFKRIGSQHLARSAGRSCASALCVLKDSVS